MTEAVEIAAGPHRLHAVRHGRASAPLAIGVHGLTGSSAQLEVLGDRLGGGGLQVVAVDLRGRGQSAPTGPGTYGWEAHARDVLAVADALEVDRFSVVGLSMGASVAMKTAELAPARLSAVVLLDVAGRVDPGVGQVVEAALRDVDPKLVDREAIAEDRAYTLTQDPYARWQHLTMPTLLVRATQEIAPGAGRCVPEDDRDRFLAEVRSAEVVEVDATHLTIADHPATADAVRAFLARR